MTDCERLKEHYETYALGALEGEERAELDTHLARGCPVCTAEVERARWLVAQLGYLAPEKEPPASLRRRLLKAARGTEFPERRGWIPAWAWAVVAALILLTVFSIRQTRKLQGELAELEAKTRALRSQTQALEADRQLYQQALAVLSATGTREVALKATGKTALPEVRAYWNAALGLVLSGQQIPSPAAGRTFQLWVVPKKGNPISAGVFRPNPAGGVLLVSVPEAQISAAKALAISVEPAPGSPQPTTTPLWVGPVS